MRCLAVAAFVLTAVATAGCTDHSDVTLEFSVRSIQEPNRVCVQAIDRNYKGYDSCYAAPADVIARLGGVEDACIRAHVEDPLQPENRDRPMSEVEILSNDFDGCR
jgi:hypothetical protein